MALIIPSHRRSREAILAAGGEYDIRNIHVAVEVDLDKDTLAYLKKVVPQCVVGEPAAKTAETPKKEIVDLDSMSKKDLIALGKDKGVKVGLTMKKDGIIGAILSAEAAKDE